MTRILFLLLAALMLAGCGLREREAKLNAREQALEQRRQQLETRELALQQREEELTKKLQALDSSAHDTLMLYEPKLIGQWLVRMTCSETTCPGSAVGDIKTETWVISYEGNFLVAKAMEKGKLARIYTGQSTAQGIRLSEAVTDPPSGPPTTINVRLSLKDNNTMEGQREILRENECRILYTLQLSKQ